MLAWRYLISASIGENLRYRSLSAAESEAGISEKQHRMEVCTVDDFREWLSDNLRYILLGLAIRAGSGRRNITGPGSRAPPAERCFFRMGGKGEWQDEKIWLAGGDNGGAHRGDTAGGRGGAGGAGDGDGLYREKPGGGKNGVVQRQDRCS